jgi:toxin ParE1/3/4
LTKYSVKILPKALQDIDSIYKYIKEEIKEIDIARKTIGLIEEGILGLDKMPFRGAIRKIGNFAYKGYRQIFINKFNIIYRINQEDKEVIIITVRHAKNRF